MERVGKNGGTLKSYEKGQSGNPAGRPVGKPDIISQIIQELGDITKISVIIEGYRDGRLRNIKRLRYATDGQNTVFAAIAIELLMRAVSGDIEAIKVVIERTEGRVPPPIPLNNDDLNSLLVIHTPNQS